MAKPATMALVLKYGSVPGVLVAIVALWTALGFPTFATGQDIKRLDREQAETATEVYQSKIRGLLVIAPAEGTVAHRAWQEELDHARQQAKSAEQRRIELKK